MYRKLIYTMRIEDAPEIRNADLMSIKEAAEYLEVSIQTVNYHMSPPNPKLTTVVRQKDEYTSYQRVRRWLIRSEVKRLKIELLDNTLRGNDWRVLDNGGILLWIPETDEESTTKSISVKSVKGKRIRHITLNQEDTGDLEIDVIAVRSGRECAIRVDIQSERLYPDMSNITVVLHLPDGERTETTGRQGEVLFESVPCASLSLARITINPSN